MVSKKIFVRVPVARVMWLAELRLKDDTVRSYCVRIQYRHSCLYQAKVRPVASSITKGTDAKAHEHGQPASPMAKAALCRMYISL
jgi:hypothetical protein